VPPSAWPRHSTDDHAGRRHARYQEVDEGLSRMALYVARNI